jgi:hypothetical protein
VEDFKDSFVLIEFSRNTIYFYFGARKDTTPGYEKWLLSVLNVPLSALETNPPVTLRSISQLAKLSLITLGYKIQDVKICLLFYKIVLLLIEVKR